MRRSYLSYLVKKSLEDPFTAPRRALQYGGIVASKIAKRSLAGPFHASIVVTYKCNLRCPMCFLWKGPGEYEEQRDRRELSTDELERVIEDFAAIGTAGVGFTGGEPLLRPDMIDLIKHTRALGMVTHLSSNGWLVANRDVARRVVESGLDAIGFSLDGARPETHDAVRGKGSYDRVLKAISNVLSLRAELKKHTNVVVVCMVSNYSVDELADMVALLKDRGVDHVSFMPFHDIGLLSFGKENSEEFKVGEDKIERLNRAVDELINIKTQSKSIENSMAYLRLFKHAFAGRKLPISCYAGYATLCVGAYGDVYPCFPRMEGEIDKGPNVRELSVKDYWYSRHIAKDRRQVEGCRECFWNNQTEINLLFHPLYRGRDGRPAASRPGASRPPSPS